MKYKHEVELTYPFFEDEEVRRLSLRKLAELTGVHYTYLSRLQKGHSAASPEMFEHLMNWLEEWRQAVPGETKTRQRS